MQPSILIIEDEENLQELIRYNLKQEGYQVVVSRSGEEGLKMALKNKPHLILLDLMLPGVDGMEICRTLKQNYKTRDIAIIIITAKSEESEIVLGLEMGADDYVTKPFSTRQLLARIKAVLRRHQEKTEERICQIGGIQLDTVRHVLSVDGKQIEMTHKEFQLIRFFMESNGRALSREQVLGKVWGIDESLEVDLRVVDKHVAELRKKLQNEGDRILTIKNHGYRFDLEDREPIQNEPKSKKRFDHKF